jgi:methionyl-tRNA formyltransferase
MGVSMNVVFLTTDDPIYLPSFFDRVLSVREDTTAVFIVPPLYKNQSIRDAAWRYFRTFGAAAVVSLTVRTVRAKIRGESIAGVCKRHEVHCETIRNVNDPLFLDRLRQLGTSLIVSVSCPQIFHKPLIELPSQGCLNIHGAILPEYRGVMPSFWMLANGEKQAGVSIFFVNEDIDAGDLCGQRIFEIREHETLDEFLRRSKAISAQLLLEVLSEIESGSVSRTPLDLSAGSYYSWPTREAVRRFRAAGRRIW